MQNLSAYKRTLGREATALLERPRTTVARWLTSSTGVELLSAGIGVGGVGTLLLGALARLGVFSSLLGVRQTQVA